MLKAEELRLLKLVAREDYGRDLTAPPLELTPGRLRVFDGLERGGFCHIDRPEGGAAAVTVSQAGEYVLRLLWDQALGTLMLAESGESIKPQIPD